MSITTEMNKVIKTMKDVAKDDEFTLKSLSRDMAFMLSRALDTTSEYSIPTAIKRTVTELKDAYDDNPDGAPHGMNPKLAEAKLAFIENLETKADAYSQMLEHWKVIYSELYGNEFKYSPAGVRLPGSTKSAETADRVAHLTSKYI